MAAQVFRHVQRNDVQGLKKTLASYEQAVTCKDQQGRTPLHVACQLGHGEVVKELLKAKAQHEAADNLGNLAIHYAVALEQDFFDIIMDLLTGSGRKMTLKKRNKAGQTPLHIAASHANLAIIVQLVENGAKNDIKDLAGHLPSQLVPPSPERDIILHTLNSGDTNRALAYMMSHPAVPPPQHTTSVTAAAGTRPPASPIAMDRVRSLSRRESGSENGSLALTPKSQSELFNLGGATSSRDTTKDHLSMLPRHSFGGRSNDGHERSSYDGSSTSRAPTPPPLIVTGRMSGAGIPSGIPTPTASLTPTATTPKSESFGGSISFGGGPASLGGAAPTTPITLAAGVSASGTRGAANFAAGARASVATPPTAPLPPRSMTPEAVRGGGHDRTHAAGPLSASRVGGVHVPGNSSRGAGSVRASLTFEPGVAARAAAGVTPRTAGNKPAGTPPTTARNVARTPSNVARNKQDPAAANAASPNLPGPPAAAGAGLGAGKNTAAATAAAVAEQQTLLHQLVQEMQSVKDQMKEYEERLEFSDSRRREVEEDFLHAAEQVKQQARQLDEQRALIQELRQQTQSTSSHRVDDEDRLRRLEDKAAETRRRLDRLDDDAITAAKQQAESRVKQDREVQDLYHRVRQMQSDYNAVRQQVAEQQSNVRTDNNRLSTLVDKASQQVAALSRDVKTLQEASRANSQSQVPPLPLPQHISPAVTRSPRVSYDVAPVSAPQSPLPSARVAQSPSFTAALNASGLPVSLAARVDDLANQVADLTMNMQSLTSRGQQSGDLETIRHRLNKLEAVGVQEALEVLDLRARQLDNKISNVQAAHMEAGEKLAGLQRWQQEAHLALGAAVSPTSPIGMGGPNQLRAGSAANLVNAGMDRVEFESVVSELRSRLSSSEEEYHKLQQDMTSLQRQVAQLQQQSSAASPRLVTPGTPSHAPLPTAPHTPPPSSAKRAALANAAMSANSESFEDVHQRIAELNRDMSSIKEAVESLKLDVSTTARELRSEWDTAVHEAAMRVEEQQREGRIREDKLKAMKQQMMAEADAQAKVADLSHELQTSLKKVNTQIGLLQHKVEVVEDQVQQMAARSGTPRATSEDLGDSPPLPSTAVTLKNPPHVNRQTR